VDHDSFFHPHGICLLWDPALVAMKVIADSMIAFAYFTIPLSLWLFVDKQQKAISPVATRILVSFVLFICLCGLTHVMDVVTIWFPWYWLDGYLRVATAIASIITAVTLWPFLSLIRFTGAGFTLERRRVDRNAAGPAQNGDRRRDRDV
jgi:hypothetical protein